MKAIGCLHAALAQCLRRGCIAMLVRVGSVAIVVVTSIASAQHADIAVYRDNELRLTTHEGNESSQPLSRVFQRNFDFFGPPFGAYAGDDPGVNMTGASPPSGVSTLPGRQVLQVGLVPVHLPGRASGNLLYWDGQGAEADFQVIPSGNQMVVEDATGQLEVSLTGSLTHFADLTFGVTGAAGGMHSHMAWVVESDHGTPAAGVYLMGWQFAMENLLPSRPVYVMQVGGTVPATARGLALDWMNQHLGEIRMTGDFDDDGLYGLPDIDGMVEAIFRGTDEVDFDLTLDGSVDTNDLNLWLEVAGQLLTPTGEAISIGDANLDGRVDAFDLESWSLHRFTATPAWSKGDFDADGNIDVRDFDLWNANKMVSASALNAVPEPAFAWWLTGLVLLVGHAKLRRV